MIKTDLKQTSICQKVRKTDLGPQKQTHLAALEYLSCEWLPKLQDQNCCLKCWGSLEVRQEDFCEEDKMC